MPAPKGNKYAEGNDGGRPTGYNEDIIKKTQKYIDKDFKIDEAVPTMAGLALYLNTTKKTLYNWAEQHEEFLHYTDKLMNSQEKKLLVGSLNNKLNAKIAQLMLSKHGYKEQIGISGEGEGQPVKVDIDIKGNIEKIYGDKSDK